MEACKINAMRLLDLLSVLQEDASVKTKLLEAQCHTLQGSLALCRKGCMDNEEENEENEENINLTVSHTETALAQALRRARVIRQAMDAAAELPSSTPTPAPAPAPVKSSTKQKISLPRNMKAKLKEFDDTTLLSKSRDAPPLAACTKLTQMLAQRDSTNAAIPVGMSYREQLNRISKAYSCILHVLETKCQESNYAEVGSTPKLPIIFPVWYRLNKIKQLLAALNAELAVCLERIPPPPLLSKRASERSLAFLKAIHKKPMNTFNNARLRSKNEISFEGIFDRLQSAWDNCNPAPSESYTACSEQIFYEELCKNLVPPLHQLSGSEKVSIDALRLLRLVHSLTCCDGLEIRSVVNVH
ncbi:hypothetical protein THRCLA_10003 [Thraustotheca clavata]|uniref:Uncharacterized protein n=1 Tax=Thraustotheca clavata TaxID=74557 RepID=A0A1V9YT81_9STRA|nr:hypothetical protein THRCLA_10003 [Thraustotheca clavata]